MKRNHTAARPEGTRNNAKLPKIGLGSLLGSSGWVSDAFLVLDGVLGVAVGCRLWGGMQCRIGERIVLQKSLPQKIILSEFSHPRRAAMLPLADASWKTRPNLLIQYNSRTPEKAIFNIPSTLERAENTSERAENWETPSP